MQNGDGVRLGKSSFPNQVVLCKSSFQQQRKSVETWSRSGVGVCNQDNNTFEKVVTKCSSTTPSLLKVVAGVSNCSTERTQNSHCHVFRQTSLSLPLPESVAKQCNVMVNYQKRSGERATAIMTTKSNL